MIPVQTTPLIFIFSCQEQARSQRGGGVSRGLNDPPLIPEGPKCLQFKKKKKKKDLPIHPLDLGQLINFNIFLVIVATEKDV